MKRLAIVVSHPIQYYAPVFKLLTERAYLQVKVFYTLGDSYILKFDPGFGTTIEWDIPLLTGYEYEFLKNTAKQPGSHHFNGIINSEAIEKIENYNPDAILIYGWSYKSHLRILRYFKNKKTILFRGDSNLIDDIPDWKNALKSVLLKWVYSHVDKALYVGTANKQYFKKYGLKEHQLQFAPHSVDNRRFSEDRSSEAKALRQRLGIKEHEILLLFAGKLEPKKNPEFLLSAFDQLDNVSLHLLFVGNGVLEKSIKAKSFRLKSSKRIHFIDFQNQQKMPVIYQASQLFCLPSYGPGETWGLAVNEAMAAGKAVLVSNKVGCAIDLVKDNVNGKIFRSEDIHELQKALQILTASPTDLRKMGGASSEIITEWNFYHQVKNIEELIV